MLDGPDIRSEHIAESDVNQSEFVPTDVEQQQQYDISIDLEMSYTTKDIKEALTELQGDVASHIQAHATPATKLCSPPVSPRTGDGKGLLGIGASLLSPLAISGREDETMRPPIERSDGADNNEVLPGSRDGQTADQQGNTCVLDKVRFFSSRSPCKTIKNFMGELLSPRDTDLHDLSEHELLSKTDLSVHQEDIITPGVEERKVEEHTDDDERRDVEECEDIPTVGKKTVRFLLDEEQSPPRGLTMKVSGSCSTSSEESEESRASSSPDVRGHLSVSDDDAVNKDIEAPTVGLSEHQATINANSQPPRAANDPLTSPTIYFSERDLPLITCIDQRIIFDLDDIIPREITLNDEVSSPPTISERPQTNVSPDEMLYAPVVPAMEPIVEFPSCESGSTRFDSEGEQNPLSTPEDVERNYTNDEMLSSDRPHETDSTQCRPTVGGQQSLEDLQDTSWYQETFATNPRPDLGPGTQHRGSFTASDLPMSAPAGAFRVIREGSDDTCDSSCSSGSLKVMPSSSQESLTVTDTYSATLEPFSEPETSETNLPGFAAAPVVLKKSLHYLSQIHQLENLVQEGNRQMQAFKVVFFPAFFRNVCL